MNTGIKKTVLLLLGIIGFSAFAQIPEDYYNIAEEKTGAELKTALHQIIKNHQSLSYSQVWNAFKDTDKKTNGKVWDMYSDIPGGTPPYEYTFVTDQCGNYNSENDCYNREHSFPKSWFNDASPMYTDLFHLYPTDGYVNGRRGNHPFGETNNATWTSMNGSKVGRCSVSGYSGTVFEPIDEYKGDFARTYFYMATRYEDKIAGWDSDMLNSTAFPAFSSWALQLLLQWHLQDPVSFKEIDRNNAVYEYQQNRNPFIDHPEFVECIWADCEEPLMFTSKPVTSVPLNGTYIYDIVTTGGMPGATRNISCVEKPDWLTLDASGNGEAEAQLSGTAINTGEFDVQLSVTDGKSFAYQSFSISVFKPAMINDEKYQEITVFIEPATKEMKIESSTSVVQVELFNLAGQRIISQISPYSSIASVQLISIPQGIYIAKIHLSDSIITEKIIIN
ncbi:MAG: endonuclease [Cytophagaceae bacterium]|jgi:endonuclease I|nr:endonuclease [Cytophagaceae bacterium]